MIATKGGWTRPNGDWVLDGRPEALRQAIDESLISLRTDCITLYQFHWPDPNVPFADSVGAVAQAQAEGKVRYVGLSNVSADQIEEALRIVPIQSVQNRYSWGHRAPESDGTLQKCRALGIAFLPWSPLGGIENAKNAGEDNELQSMAREQVISPQRAALQWLLSQYDRLIPIPGATRIASIEDSAAAADDLDIEYSKS